MYLKQLEIQGFKSFARKTVLTLDPGITAVVGPNGSGKSNVADALRWVMGGQSLKILRGKKSEDVIFAGSDKKSKLSMAEVSLTFDNRDHKIPLEYSEVVVTRRIYRDGEAEYLINNQKSRLLDIVDILIRSGFGATNYAVIGQGMIDQMILGGPAEIKNLIEEASGVKPYYIKREKTFRRLEQTEENLERVNALVNEIEPRLRSLRRQAKRMEEREVVANDLKDLQLIYFGNQFLILETELNSLNDQVEIKQKYITDLESNISDFQKTLEKEEQQSKSSANFASEITQKINHLETRKFSLQENLAEIRGKMKADFVPGSKDSKSLNVERLDLDRKIENLKDRRKQTEQDYRTDLEKYEELKKQVAKLNEQMERAQNQKFDKKFVSDAINSFELEFRNLLSQLTASNLEDIKNRFTHLLSKLSGLKSGLGQANVDINHVLMTKDQISMELHALELRMVEQKTIIEAYSEQIENGSAKLNQIKNLLLENPEEYKSELFKQESELNKQLIDIQNQITELHKSSEKVLAEDRKKKQFLMEEEKKYRQKSNELATLKEEVNRVLIEKARFDTRMDVLNKEAANSLGEKIKQISSYKKLEVPGDLTQKIEKLKRQLEFAGGIDDATLAEYRETQERFDYLSTQSVDLTKAVTDLRTVIEELDQIIKIQFNEAFHKISEKFSDYFRILFSGGKAQMSLLKAEITEGEDSDLEEKSEEQKVDGIRRKQATVIEGIEIKATPPGKKLSSIAALSGGERALTAIALLCSLLASYPSPFVVLDEVDAALDEANSIRFAKILGTLAHQTQFITITHNRETMRQGHTLYGVTMSDEGISKILSLKLEQAEKIEVKK